MYKAHANQRSGVTWRLILLKELGGGGGSVMCPSTFSKKMKTFVYIDTLIRT